MSQSSVLSQLLSSLFVVNHLDTNVHEIRVYYYADDTVFYRIMSL